MTNAITSSTSSSSKGYVPEMSAAAKASLAKGKAEKEAKTAASTGSTTVSISKEGASKLATENKANATPQAGTTAGATTTAKADPADGAAARADARRADQAAWRAAHTRNPSKSQAGGATATTATATATPAQGAAPDQASSGGKVKFGSVDEAIAYGTRRAAEQYQKQQALRG